MMNRDNKIDWKNGHKSLKQFGLVQPIVVLLGAAFIAAVFLGEWALFFTILVTAFLAGPLIDHVRRNSK